MMRISWSWVVDSPNLRQIHDRKTGVRRVGVMCCSQFGCCLVNSLLSTSNAKGMCADIKDFYLNTEMTRFE